mgnify:CR=1 FL=1
MTTPEQAKTEQEYLMAVETEKAEEEFARLGNMATRAVSDGQRKYAAAKLKGLFGVGDYVEADAGEAPKH